MALRSPVVADFPLAVVKRYQIKRLGNQTVGMIRFTIIIIGDGQFQNIRQRLRLKRTPESPPVILPYLLVVFIIVFDQIQR